MPFKRPEWRERCETCEGTGRLKHAARAGSKWRVGKKYFAGCMDCNGEGFITRVGKLTEATSTTSVVGSQD